MCHGFLKTVHARYSAETTCGSRVFLLLALLHRPICAVSTKACELKHATISLTNQSSILVQSNELI